MPLVTTFSHPVWMRLADVLVHFLWQGTLIALLAATAIWLLRNQRASVRYCVLLTAFSLLALTPAAMFLASAADRESTTHASAITSTPDVHGPLVPWPTEPTMPPFRLGEPVTDANPPRIANTDQPEIVSVSAPQPTDAAHRTWQPVAVAAWLSGVVLLWMRLLVSAAATWWWRQGHTPLPPLLSDRVPPLAQTLGLRRAPRVYLSDRVRQAVVDGYLRPMILIPLSWTSQLPLPVLEAVLAHELAHLRRLDVWVILFQRLVETFLFYHPAVWWLSRQLSRERERCCDELAAAAIGSPVTYASSLETVGRLILSRTESRRRSLLQATLTGRPAELLSRVQHVLRLTGSRTSRSHDQFSTIHATLAATLLPVLALVLVLLLRSSHAESPQPADDKDRDESVGNKNPGSLLDRGGAAVGTLVIEKDPPPDPAEESPVKLFGHPPFADESRFGLPEPRLVTPEIRAGLKRLAELMESVSCSYEINENAGPGATLDTPGLTLQNVNVSLSHATSKPEVRALCEELEIPISLQTGSIPDPNDQLLEPWLGCPLITSFSLSLHQGTQFDFEKLAEFPALTQVGLFCADYSRPVVTREPVTQAMIDGLSSVRDLQRLMIVFAPVTAERLDGLRSLRSLWITQSSIAAGALDSLQEIPRLEQLRLDGTSFPPGFRIDPSTYPALRSVGVTAAGATSIRQALEQCVQMKGIQGLKSVYLNGLNLPDMPDFDSLPGQVDTLELGTVAIDHWNRTGFADARLVAGNVAFSREKDTDNWQLSRMAPGVGGPFPNEIVGVLAEPILFNGVTVLPGTLRRVEFLQWDPQRGFYDNPVPAPGADHFWKTTVVQLPRFATAAENAAAERLAVLGAGVRIFDDGLMVNWNGNNTYLRIEPSPHPVGRLALPLIAQLPVARLWLHAPQVSADELLELPQMESVRRLSINQERLSDAHLDVLARVPNLVELSIECDKQEFTREALERLSQRFPQAQISIVETIPGADSGRILMTQQPGQPPVFMVE